MRRLPASILMVVLAALASGRASAGPESASAEVPPAFEPFQHLIGAWKGMGIPTANRLKGWPERHLWAWAFADGRPVGMTLTTEGDKVLARGRLSLDAEGQYRLEGTDPAGKPVAFAGSMDEGRRVLTLDREGEAGAGRDRLTIRLNSNLIRYTLTIDHQEPGAPQFARVIDVNVGKEGESFAAGGSAADLPECVLTGGAATMTVAYGGKSYPVCCSGCRDEFLADPEKYVKKALLQARDADSDGPKAGPASPRFGQDDGAFDGLVDEPEPGPPSPRPRPSEPKAQAEPGSEPVSKKEGPDPSVRAASLVRSAQALERLGKATQALDFYRQVVKEYPGTPQARAAAERIRALEK